MSTRGRSLGVRAVLGRPGAQHDGEESLEPTCQCTQVDQVIMSHILVLLVHQRHSSDGINSRSEAQRMTMTCEQSCQLHKSCAACSSTSLFRRASDECSLVNKYPPSTKSRFGALSSLSCIPSCVLTLCERGH